MKSDMKTLIKKFNDEKGLTFFEVMLAMTITGFVTAAIFQLYITQHQHYLIQDDITEIQQNARASIDQLAKTVRMAGYDIPDGVAAIKAYNTNSDTVILTYRENNCQGVLLNNMGSSSAPMQCNGSVACFTAGQWVYIFHPDSGGGEYVQLSSVDNGSNTLNHASDPLSKAYTKDAEIVILKEVKYYIDATTAPNNPRLMVQNKGQAPIIFADNIVDLQFQYKMKNGMTLDVPPLSENVREVIISLKGRSKDPNVEDKNNPYRFRTFNTTVSVRNLVS